MKASSLEVATSPLSAKLLLAQDTSLFTTAINQDITPQLSH